MPDITNGTPAVVVQPSQGGGTVTTVSAGHAGGGTITTVAGGVIDALKTSPVLLLIVLLNAAFIFAAAYFLMLQEGYRATDRAKLIEMIDGCITKTVPMDFLLRQQN